MIEDLCGNGHIGDAVSVTQDGAGSGDHCTFRQHFLQPILDAMEKWGADYKASFGKAPSTHA